MNSMNSLVRGAAGLASSGDCRSRPYGNVLPMRAAVGEGKDPQCNAAFIALLDAYRPTGGLLRGDDLADLLIARDCGDHASLARSMTRGEILWFDWNRTVWVPAFQLDRDTLAAGSGTRRVLAELSRAFDGWSAAQWFVTPNAWLQERTPVEMIGAHLDAVLEAVRADCFIANG